MHGRLVVTFDLFSALTDTRTGAARVLGEIAAERGWPVPGAELYDAWDARNKAAQREARPPTSFAEVSRGALEAAYADLGLAGAPSDAAADLARLHASVVDWPLWPDVADGVRAVAALPEVAGVGLLSNVDDALARRTRAAALVSEELLLTSELLGAFKPSPEIYRRAVARVAPRTLVHVAASARDVRGSLEAEIRVVRLARPGHVVDPDGPQPDRQVDDAADLAGVLRDVAG